jgi:hypothetical protein
MSKEIKIGDIVICINNGDINSRPGYNPPLRYNGVYIVNNIDICSCGAKSLDVNLNTTNSMQKQTMCYCGQLIPGERIHWCDSRRFAKKDESSEKQKESEYIDNSELVKELLTHQIYES